MPIDRIPILSEDYPLFDWDDYPLSYYALGEGELVSGFQKETWNAIIDKTKEALSAAGLYWDNFYTTAESAKVKQSYGALSANMFNSVRLNMDVLTPVGWGWAKNPNMRGYVGREYFRGYSEFGMDGDLFYAEYLLEMVRRLNLTLSIMKGTANLNEMSSQAQAVTLSIQNLQKAIVAQMAFSEPAFSSFVCGLQAKKAGQLNYIGNGVSKHIVTVTDIPVRRMYGRSNALGLSKGKQQAPFAANLKDHAHLLASLSQAAMEIFNCIYLSSGHGLSKTYTQSHLMIPRPYRLQVDEKSISNISATPVTAAPKPVQSTVASKTDTTSTAKAPWGIAAKSSILSKAKHSTDFDRLRPRRLSHQSLSETNLIAYLDSAWYAPIWVNGKLYIRQVYEANLTDATLEVT